MFETLATVCEILLLVCFGASWPFNVAKAYRARTTKGTSLLFMSLIATGYVAGILKQTFTFIGNPSSTGEPLKWVALGFYIFNFLMVSTGILVYFRNKGFDKKSTEKSEE